MAEVQVDVYVIPELQLKLDRLDQNVHDSGGDALSAEVEAVRAQTQGGSFG